MPDIIFELMPECIKPTFAVEVVNDKFRSFFIDGKIYEMVAATDALYDPFPLQVERNYMFWNLTRFYIKNPVMKGIGGNVIDKKIDFIVPDKTTQ